MRLRSWIFPHGEVSGSWLLGFSFPQEISCSLGKHPWVPCSSPGRNRLPRVSWSGPSPCFWTVRARSDLRAIRHLGSNTTSGLLPQINLKRHHLGELNLDN